MAAQQWFFAWAPGTWVSGRISIAADDGLTALGAGFVLYFSEGLTALNTFDFWVGTFCIFVLATFQTILFGRLHKVYGVAGTAPKGGYHGSVGFIVE